MNEFFRLGFEKLAGGESRKGEVRSALKATGNYTISKGDTLSGLAKKLGTTVDSLMQQNPHIKHKDRIYAGGKLSTSGETAAQAPASAAAPSKPQPAAAKAPAPDRAKSAPETSESKPTPVRGGIMNRRKPGWREADRVHVKKEKGGGYRGYDIGKTPYQGQMPSSVDYIRNRRGQVVGTQPVFDAIKGKEKEPTGKTQSWLQNTIKGVLGN